MVMTMMVMIMRVMSDANEDDECDNDEYDDGEPRKRLRRGIREGPCTCRLGCTGSGNDSIEHYLRCPILRKWMQDRLQANAPPGHDVSALFLHARSPLCGFAS